MICLAVPGTEVYCLLIGPPPSVLGSDWLRAPDLAAPGIQGPWLLVSSCHLWTLLAGTPAPSWPGQGRSSLWPLKTKQEESYQAEFLCLVRYCRRYKLAAIYKYEENL